MKGRKENIMHIHFIKHTRDDHFFLKENDFKKRVYVLKLIVRNDTAYCISMLKSNK
jgi:hypothetical protein